MDLKCSNIRIIVNRLRFTVYKYKLISSHTDKYNIILSAECGDYVVEDYPDHTYLSTFKFVPQQDGQLERRIMENHKKHV